MQRTIIRSKEDFGQAVRRRRRENGWTQGDLGARAGLAAKHISRIENGVLEARLSTVFALAAALGLDLSVAARSGSEAARHASPAQPHDPDGREKTDGPDEPADSSTLRGNTGATEIF